MRQQISSKQSVILHEAGYSLRQRLKMSYREANFEIAKITEAEKTRAIQEMNKKIGDLK